MSLGSEAINGISTLDRTARADFSGLDFGGRLEAGARLIRSERAVVEPYVSVGYVHLERSRIDEKGADSVNLHASREEIDSALVGAGIRARAIFHLDADLVILPEIHAEWNQQVADRDRRVDATLEGATAGSRTRVYVFMGNI